MSNTHLVIIGILITVGILAAAAAVIVIIFFAIIYRMSKVSDSPILSKVKMKTRLDVNDFDEPSEEVPISSNRKNLRAALTEYDAKVRIIKELVGPRLTTYMLKMNRGVKPESLHGLENALKMEMGVKSLIIHAPMGASKHVGIEIPNETSRCVSFREILSTFDGSMEIPLALGLDTVGNPVKIDLVKCPHLLIAGATGSGKSVCQHSLIMSAAYNNTPDQLRMILIDPKRVEFHMYQRLPHLLTNVVKDYSGANDILQWLVQKMESRNVLLEKHGVRNIQGYNKIASNKKKMSYIMVVIDELADLMMSPDRKSIEESLVKLAQMARAVGIHLVLATQRPSVNVITGVLKANIPTRLAFQVASITDSRVIIDQKGAEALLGSGDMIVKGITNGTSSLRVQGCFLSDEEITHVINKIGV